jgi:hypothetical protein
LKGSSYSKEEKSKPLQGKRLGLSAELKKVTWMQIVAGWNGCASLRDFRGLCHRLLNFKWKVCIHQ